MTTGYLWTGQFPESSLPVEEGRPQSMELQNESVQGHWETNYDNGMDFFIINDAIIQKICILGDDVEPCFEGASVTAPDVSTKFTLDDNFKHTLYSMMQDLKNALNGGGQQMDNLENTVSVEEETVTPVSNFTQVDEVASETVSEVNENIENTSAPADYVKEDDEKETKTIYAVNKLACEGILQAYKDSFDIPYTVFRICIPYGNLLSNDYSFGTVGFFIKQAEAGKDITLYGGGTIKRTFTHMEDLCNQVIEGAFKPGSNGEVYNVGGETLSLHDAAEIIAKKYGVSVTAVPWPERDLRIESDHTYFDDKKIQTLLHFGAYKKLNDFTKDL